ncbi:MAG: protein BatD [Bacteroidales bacterium]|nr:protein BatD [Bacteroidales bacterium]
MKQIITLFLFLLTNFLATSQEVRITAQAPTTVATGATFRYTVNVNARPSNFKGPNFGEFNVIMGPSTSSSSSISIVNGQVSQDISYSYSYVLSADKEGKYTISPAEAIVNGKTYKSNAITIEVVKGNTNVANQNNRSNYNYDNDNYSQPANVSNEDVFIRVNVNKTNVYQGEQLVASVYIYTRLNIVGFEDIKFPNMNGFWSEDLENPNQINLKQEYINGQLYGVGLLKRVILSPTRSGKLTIDPVQATIMVQQKVQSRRRSIFDDFFGTYQNVSKKLVSPTITIYVKPLPENKPQPFSGGVGSFNLESHVDNTSVKMNEAFTYSLKLSGTGNIKLIDIPKPNFPSDFEVYDPKTTNNYSIKDGQSSGSKTVSYIIIPRHHGNYTIPAFDFHYFDLKTRSYKTIHINEVTISVSKDSSYNATAVVSEFAKKDVSVLGSDIRYIKNKVEPLKPIHQYIWASTLFKMVYPFSFLLLIVLLFLRREQIKQRANIMAMRNKKANRVATKRLKQAQKCIKTNNQNQFYEEITKALWGYLSDKLMIPIAEFTRESAIEKLKEKNIENEIIDELNQILDNCEYARYAPSAINQSITEIYNKAAKTIKTLESLI